MTSSSGFKRSDSLHWNNIGEIFAMAGDLVILTLMTATIGDYYHAGDLVMLKPDSGGLPR